MSQILDKVNKSLSDLERDLNIVDYEEDHFLRLSLFGFVAIEFFDLKFNFNSKVKSKCQVSFEFIGSE